MNDSAPRLDVAIVEGIDKIPRAAWDGLLAPDDIADTYWFLHTQKRSAWTFELDIRPFLEVITNF